MTPDTIFAEAIAIDSAEQRAAFLDDSCRDDPALRREVEGLVRDYFRAGDFLARPATPVDEPVCERPGTVTRHTNPPADPRSSKLAALERLVQLYDAWGKREEAAKWRQELEAHT